MDTRESGGVTVGSLIVGVVVPLAIVLGAFVVGSGVSTVLLGDNSGFVGFALALAVGAVVYAVSLPVYYALFLKEW